MRTAAYQAMRKPAPAETGLESGASTWQEPFVNKAIGSVSSAIPTRGLTTMHHA